MVIADGDKGANRGELAFDLHVAGTWAYTSGFHRLGSGSVFVPAEPGTTRPGVTVSAPVDGRHRLGLLFGAAECDWQRLARCPREAGGTDLSASAAASVDLRAAFLPGEHALPPGFATGLPTGHDAYVVAEGSGGGVRFRAFATVDVWVAG